MLSVWNVTPFILHWINRLQFSLIAQQVGMISLWYHSGHKQSQSEQWLRGDLFILPHYEFRVTVNSWLPCDRFLNNLQNIREWYTSTSQRRGYDSFSLSRGDNMGSEICTRATILLDFCHSWVMVLWGLFSHTKIVCCSSRYYH